VELSDGLSLLNAVVIADLLFGFGDLREGRDPEGHHLAESGSGTEPQCVLARRAVGRDFELDLDLFASLRARRKACGLDTPLVKNNLARILQLAPA
jgi:hypothetical protein